MKLKEGMYVRTKQGYIAKFKKYDEIFNILRFETPIFLRSWMPCDYMQKDRFMNWYFSKASYNIIDLIEVGDYVNGKKVIKVNIDYIFDYSEEIKIVYFNEEDYIYSSEDIKSIVTKEQFESMSYKVGD